MEATNSVTIFTLIYYILITLSSIAKLMNTAAVFLVALTPSDYIAIINLLITSALGIWIGFTVQSNLATSRAVKDYFIQEAQEIRKEYDLFQSALLRGTLSPPSIQQWLSSMTMRIRIFEEYINREFNSKSKCTALTEHNRIKRFITATPEFNNQFTQLTLVLQPGTQTTMMNKHKNFIKCMHEVIVSINVSKRK